MSLHSDAVFAAEANRIVNGRTAKYLFAVGGKARLALFGFKSVPIKRNDAVIEKIFEFFLVKLAKLSCRMVVKVEKICAEIEFVAAKTCLDTYVFKELSVLMSAVKEIIALSVKAITDGDLDAAERVEPLEERIDDIRDDVKKRHIVRLQNSLCTMEHGFVLSDILINLERVADHCSNIAGCILDMSKHNSLELHKYLDEYKHDTEHFDQLYKEYSDKYCLE